jgi:hypothetical protein
MEDDKSTTDPELDTNLEDQDVELEDIEVSEEDIKDIEKDEDGESESEVESDVEKPEVEKDESEESTESQDEEESEEVELTEAEKQKTHNKEMAEKRIAEKQQREAVIRQQQSNYIEGTEDPLESATRQNQVEIYNFKVENLTNKLTNSYERAIKDFDVLSNQSPEVKAIVDEAIDTFQALYVPVDAYGNPKEIKADFYQYLQNKAESIQKLTGIKSQKQTEAKTKEKSKVFTPPAKTPKTPKSDPYLDAFNEEASRW